MMRLRAKYSKRGQMKIQQMAFVLVAIFIFFGMVALFFISIRTSALRASGEKFREGLAREAVAKMATTPEFLVEGCSNCLDMDKALAIKEIEGYGELWGFDYVMIERLYPPSEERECTRENYPDCNKITIVQKGEIGIPNSAFVSLCRQINTGVGRGYMKCEIGRIHVTGEVI